MKSPPLSDWTRQRSWSAPFRGTVAIVVVLLSLLVACTRALEESLLMVGNSFTDANHLEEMIQKMLEESAKLTTIYALRFDQGSSRFAEHANNSQLHSMLQERHWKWVVLQEQSEIPAFGDTYYEPTLTKSIGSAKILNDWIVEGSQQTTTVNFNRSTDTILFMTWARNGPDPYYEQLFPDYASMQSKLVEGYLRIQNNISVAHRPVPIAPVGLAFEYVFRHSDKTQEENIYQKPSPYENLFPKLYAEDTIHPSVWGSYLAACTIYATLRPTPSFPVVRMRYRPPEMTEQVAHALQLAAQHAVDQFNVENYWNRRYLELKRASKGHPPPEEPSSGGSSEEPSSGGSSKEPSSGGSSANFVHQHSTAVGVAVMLGAALLVTGLGRRWRREDEKTNQFQPVTPTEDDEDLEMVVQ